MKKRVLSLILALVTVLSLSAPAMAEPAPEPVETAEPTEELPAEPIETAAPTLGPTEAPAETAVPTEEPTEAPVETSVPTEEPTEGPIETAVPTLEPTEAPAGTTIPTLEPTEMPTETSVPTTEPTPDPDQTPEPSPSASPEPTPDPNLILITILAEHPYAYTGFSGIYQQIMVGEKTVYQSDSGLMLSAEPIPDEQYNAQFLPRDMGDGGYAFENRQTEYRIAGAGAGSALPMTLYNIRQCIVERNDDFAGLDSSSQHWVREDAGNGQYYLRNMSTGLYMGVSGDTLVAVNAADAATVTFRPLYGQSPLYLLSIDPGYGNLTANQRARLERVYESVAGDVFEQEQVYHPSNGFSNDPKRTPRALIDEIYYKVAAGADAYTRLNSYLSTAKAYVSRMLASSYKVRTDLPGTEGVTYTLETTGDGEYIDAANGYRRMQNSYIRLYKDGSLEQEIRIAIEQCETGQKNAETFAKALTHIPHVLRQHIKQARSIETEGNGQLSARLDAIYVDLATTSTDGGMLYQVIHELGHSQDCAYYLYLHPSYHDTWMPWTVYNGSAWKQAREADVFSPSDYATGAATEDFAEFCRFYFTAYSHQDWYQALRILFPARYELFKQIREEIMSGYSLFDDGTKQPEVTVTPEPTATPSPTPEPTATPSPTPEPTPTPSPTPTATPEPTPTPSPTPTATPEPVTPTDTPAPTETATPSPTPTATPEPVTPTDTPAPTETATPTPTNTATPEPVQPTETATPTPTATATPEPTVTATPAGPATSEPFVTPTPTPSPTPAAQQVTVQADSAPGAPAASIAGTDTAALTAAVLTDAEKEQVRQGQNVTITLQVANADASETEQAAVTECLNTSAPGYIAGAYLDVSLLKQIGASDPEYLTGTGIATVTVTVDVPEAIRAPGRSYVLVRLHDGLTDVLTDLDSDPDTITFRTDRFSLYAIAYAVEPTATAMPVSVATATPQPVGSPTAVPTASPAAPAAPDTGDETPLALYGTMLMLCVAGLVLVRRKKRRHE